MHKDSVHRFFAAYMLELRFICLHWSYWVIQFAWSAYLISSFVNGGSVTLTAASQLSTLGLMPLLSLVMMFLAGISVTRSVRSRFDTIEDSFPTGVEVIFGKWLALMTAAAGLLIVQLATALALGPLNIFLHLLPFFLLETLTLFGLIAAALWLVQVTFGVKRWMYLLFVVLWLGSAILPSSLNVEVFPFALMLAFSAYGYLGTLYSEVWERLMLVNLSLYYDLFYAALLILIIALIVWQIERRRFYRRSVITLAVIGIAGIIAAGAVRGYSLIVVAENEQSDRLDQFVVSHRDHFVLPADMPYTVSAYDVTLDLADFSRPIFQARMDIRNQSDQPLTQIDVSLNYELAIHESSVPFERDGDFVSFMLPEALPPDEAITIDLAYEGGFWEYAGSPYTVGRPRQVSSFVDAAGVNLSCSDLWYPVPGRLVLGRMSEIGPEFRERTTPDCIAAEPGRFTLHVLNGSDLQFASNLPHVGDNVFASSATTWAHLMGAPELITTEIAGITVITSLPLYDRVRSLVETHYPPALAHLRRFFPEVTGLTVFIVDAGFGQWYQQMATPMTDDQVVVVTAPFYLTAFPESPYNDYLFNGQAMVNSLFGVGAGLRSDSVANAIGFFLWAHYMADGHAEEMQTLLTQGIPQGNRGMQSYSSQTFEERYPLAFYLYQVYVTQGENSVIELLRDIYADAPHLNSLTQDDVITWLDETIHAP